MNRLTIRASSGLIHLKDNKEMTVNTAIKKLAEYEDIGTVEDFKKALENVRTLSGMYEKLSDKEVEEYHKLAEYEELEEQGKLPVAIGELIYYANKLRRRVVDVVVEEIKIDPYGFWVITYEGVHAFDDFGKTVFLTKAEAEAALKEMI